VITSECLALLGLKGLRPKINLKNETSNCNIYKTSDLKDLSPPLYTKSCKKTGLKN